MKALFLGLGAIGQRHLRNLREVVGPDLEVSAVRARGLDHVLTDGMQVAKSGGLREEFGIREEPDLETALAARPDALFVCNPTNLHLSAALAGARAGIPLFIEKPLAHTLEGIDELIELVESRRLPALVGFQFRFHPILAKAREWLADGVIGPVLSVRSVNAEYLPKWHPYEDYRISYAARADLGGGAILTQIHDMDYLYSLFGLPCRVVAMGGQLSSLEVDIEDTVEILMDFPSERGALPVSLHLDYHQRPPQRNCHILGDRGQLRLDFAGMTAERIDESGTMAERHSFEGFERNRLFLDQTRHFLDCLADRAQPLVTVRDAAASLRMAMAARESLASGKIATLTSTPS